MLGGRFRDAMSDMTETIRRVFQDPPARTVALELRAPAARTVPLPSAQVLAPHFRMVPATAFVPVLEPVPPMRAELDWAAALVEEAGWGQWAAGARVCVPELFQSGRISRLAVPPLPRRPQVLAEPPEVFRGRARSGLEAMAAPRTRALAPALEPPRSFRALEQALAMPVAFPCEDMTRISRAIWMRYTLKLVRETGENIRNLDVLGLYRIPSRGTRQVNHQAATGRLLVALGPEAAGAPRAPFILARKKDDDSIVCCFVEDV